MNKIQHLLIALLIGSVPAAAQIPLDSLNAHYSFNGNLNDLSGNSNHITSASGNYTADRFGASGSAYLLDGINDSLVIPVPQFAPIQGDFTISFWYKTNTSAIMNLFSSKQSASDTTDNFEIQLNSHNTYYQEYYKQLWYQTFVYWNGTGQGANAVAEGAPGFFTKGEWSHFVITRNVDTLRIYRNHSLYTLSLNNTFAGTLGDATDLIFSAAPFRFKGAIDEMRLYNRGLSQVEIDKLWFEDSPFHFTSPKSTDAFVQGSVPLIYWEYDDVQIGDSINVEYRINNAAWQLWPAHSQMAYENGFYMNLSYPPGTTIEIRVSDFLDTNIHQTTGTFIVSEYDWQEATSTLPFNAKDGAGLISLNNRMWLLGGWDPPYHPPLNTHSEVWSSADGVNWNFETSAPWPARHCAGWIGSDSLMWVAGGDPQSGCLTDVWQSADGVNWTELEDTIPGYSRRNNANYAYANNMLYLFGGEECGGVPSNEVWQSADGVTWTQLPNAPWSGRGMQVNTCVDSAGQIWMLGGSNEGDRRSYNEVWKTADGINWTLVNESAPWGGRYWHTTAWFDNKIWLMGGMATAYEMNDVWYSADGITWHELKTTTGNVPAATRHAQSTTVFDNALWYMCG
ncbi:MAG: LamG-like jellyroll fold domain-containing protein, partial [Bacteroidia bacterium]